MTTFIQTGLIVVAIYGFIKIIAAYREWDAILNDDPDYKDYLIK